MSGDVVLRRVTARRIDAGSVSGHIKLDDVQCERVSASTTSGGVWFTRHARAQRPLRAEVVLGRSARRCSAGNTGFELDANSFSGEVRTDFPITTRGTSARRGAAAQR